MTTIKLLVEAPDMLSDYHRWYSTSANGEKGKRPELTFVRVELERLRTGMQDFVVRVTTPTYENLKSGTTITIRGVKQLSKLEACRDLAKIVASALQQRGDETFNWGAINVDHFTEMLYPFLKFFVIQSNSDTLRFTTEALVPKKQVTVQQGE